MKNRPQATPTKHQCNWAIIMKLSFKKLWHDSVRMKKIHFRVGKTMVFRAMCLKVCFHDRSHLRSRKETRLLHLLTGVNIFLSCSTWNGNWPDTQGLTHGHCAQGPCLKEAGTSRVPRPLHSSHGPLALPVTKASVSLEAVFSPIYSKD